MNAGNQKGKETSQSITLAQFQSVGPGAPVRWRRHVDVPRRAAVGPRATAATRRLTAVVGATTRRCAGGTPCRYHAPACPAAGPRRAAGYRTRRTALPGKPA